MTAEKHCLNFVIDYCKNHWDNINHDKVDVAESPKDFIREAKKDFYLVAWFITEVLNWGIKEPVDIQVNDEPLVYNLNGKEVKFEATDDYDWIVSFAEKRKKIIYEYV